MRCYLLIGAGFSRNWGGWLANEVFEYLLGDPGVMSSPELRDLLWACQPKGGFELALDELRRLVQRQPSLRSTLDAFEAAIVRMFDTMNAGYGSYRFESTSDNVPNRRPLQSFLSSFDAIFSLNQDLLLERHYLANKDNGFDFDGWKKWQLPGMVCIPTVKDGSTYPSATQLWRPSGAHAVDAGQPIFKLHGSSNWRTADEKGMLILGGGKRSALESFPVLKWYFDEFATRLVEPNIRLMVIGYSFGDEHVNQVLYAAIQRGLRMFIIDPNGSDVGKVRNQTSHPSNVYKPSELEENLKVALIGASRRGVQDIFGRDAIEHGKVLRFFEI